MLEKSKCDGIDPYVALLNLRNTSHDQVLGSLAQRVQACDLTYQQLLPDWFQICLILGQWMSSCCREDYSRRDILMGQCTFTEVTSQSTVRVQTPVGYARLGVIRRPPTPEQPRSYIVTANSKDYARNRRMVLKVIEPDKDSATWCEQYTVKCAHEPMTSVKSYD